MRSLVLSFGALLIITSCNRSGSLIRRSGIISAPGITNYMYGTHVLVNDNGGVDFALKSNSVNLDKYLDKKVKLKARKVAGYPVSGGPVLLEVLKVR